MAKPEWVTNFGLFNAEARADVLTWIWIAVFVFWGWATLHNFLAVGTFKLADLPTGLATVLVAVPLSKVIVEGVKAMRAAE